MTNPMVNPTSSLAATAAAAAADSTYMAGFGAYFFLGAVTLNMK